jgi:hypothetical protein
VISPEAAAAAIRLVRAEEAWEPVIFGGMIPIIGAGGIAFILWRAIKSNPENDPPEEKSEDGPDQGPPSPPPT